MDNKNQQVDEIDGLFLAIAQRHSLESRQLLDSCIGFLLRKTDFFLNADQNFVLETFKKYKGQSNSEAVNVAPSNKVTEDEKTKNLQELGVKKNETGITSDTEKCAVEPVQKNDDTSNGSDKTTCYRLENGKFMPNIGNGCDLEKYKWTQTYSDLEIKIPLNVEFYAYPKHVVVNFLKNHLTVGLKNQTPIIDDYLQFDINLQKSDWCIQNGKTVVMSLNKVDRKNWWTKFFVSDPEIDRTKIKPTLGDKIFEIYETFGNAKNFYSECRLS